MQQNQCGFEPMLGRNAVGIGPKPLGLGLFQKPRENARNHLVTFSGAIPAGDKEGNVGHCAPRIFLKVSSG